MSIRLDCPNCGERPLEEFLYGEILRVPDSVTAPDARDVDRAFMHDNVEGVTTERWFHAFGCRRWMDVKRDTRTEKILSSSSS